MELKELIKNVAKSLYKKEIEYMIIGGQAVLIYGEPRLTRDIDITLGVSTDKYEIIERIVKELNLKIIPENPFDFVKKTMVLPVIDEESGIRIDFIFSFSEYEKEALKRVNRIKIDDTEVCYASCEDLIIHKIVAGRERDMEDVKNIILKNKNIDARYITKWLSEFEKVLNEKLVEKFKKIMEE
ncbi:MAG: nucleotidyltransferase [Candidatus Ratteibacteria bacterium]